MINTIEDYNETINKLRQFIRSWGKADVYLVGGCVRDEILGLVPKDIDIVVDYPNGSEEFTNHLRTTYGPDVCRGYTVFPKFGTARFSLCIGQDKWIPIECVIPRTEEYEGTTRKPSSVKFGSLYEDARRRDFCCNALYKNVLGSDVIDPTGHGLEDLHNKILRTPIDPEKTFLDDPLRMLRAIRFSVCKGFTIDQETYDKIKLYKSFYDLSKERIQDELNKIMLSSKPIEGIRMLQDRGLLIRIFPNLSMYWGMDQKSKYHSYDLTEHTFKVLEGVMVNKYPEIPRNNELELRLAALLHDVGKGQSKIVNSDGTCSYYGHDKTSARIAETELKALKYPNSTIELVCKLIENHMCIKNAYSYETHEYTGSPKFTRKISRRLKGFLSLEMDLIEADNMAHAPEYCMPGQVRTFWTHYKNDVILSRTKDSDSKFEQPVDGNTIMSKLGVSGKAVGDIKKLFDSWYLDDPRLEEKDLFKRYLDFTDGIEIWIAKQIGGVYVVSYNEPTIEEFVITVPPGSTEIKYTPDIWKENIRLKDGEKIKVEASKYPGLHVALQNHKKADLILQEIGKKLEELSLLDNFSEVSISYDCQNDISSRIAWQDGRNDLLI